MSKQFFGRLVTLLVIASSAACATNSNFSNEIEQKTESIQQKQQNLVEPTYQTDKLKIVKALNEPVRITDVRSSGRDNELLIEVKNTSPKSIIFIQYVFAPANDCPKSNHPLAYSISYGNLSLISDNKNQRIKPPIAPNQTVAITISSKIYEGVLKSQKSAKCTNSAKPELVLRKVAFNDNTGWEGFADGVDHSQWSGRQWTPQN